MRSNATILATAAVLSMAACGDNSSGSTDATGLVTITGVTEGPTAPGTSGDVPTGSGSGTDGATTDEPGGPTTGEPTGGPTSTTAEPSTSTDTSTSTGTSTGDETTGAPVDVCKVQDDMDAIGECDKEAPPDSFDPEIQWTWTGATEPYSIVTPLVANLTDDNQDGAIDLCDTPDILVVASTSSGSLDAPGHIYLLDGQTGAVHLQFAEAVDHSVTPALGDIDGDGLPEIVTSLIGGNPIAFEHDGTVKWKSPHPWPEAYSGAFALGDVDNDGDIEIFAGNKLFDHNGAQLVSLPQVGGNWSASALADLDGDGDLELVLGHAAYQHTGEPVYVSAVAPGYPSIANLDADPEPEILITNTNGLALLDHDGTVQYQDQRPTGDPIGFTTWLRPSTVHDFNGDGEPEYAVSSANNYTVYKPQGPSILWKTPVSDLSGIAAGTAFDFLGDGVAEAMYADEQYMFIFGGSGEVLLQIPRSSGTLSEYPVVADVDNDGSAEIVVVSCQYGAQASPTVQVIRDKQDRWIQARRIWNQHTYHITNVREDGTIPQVEPPHWKQLNTYRTNSQIEDGGLCKPPIPQ